MILKILRHRQALTKIRISAHILQIEKGRYCRPVIPREQGICKFCRSTENACDDEIHFLTKCHFHSDKRNRLFKQCIVKVTLINLSLSRCMFFAHCSSNFSPIFMKFHKR